MKQPVSLPLPHLNATRRRRVIPITRIHDAVADLADEIELCVSVRPRGIPVQLIYEAFCFARGFTADGRSQEIGHLLDHVPQHLEDDYLWGSCSGDFDLCGQLWLSPSALVRINRANQHKGLPQYHSIEEAIDAFLRTIPGSEHTREELFFTPTWSHDLIGTIYATYAEFLMSMGNSFPVEEPVMVTVKTIENAIAHYEARSGYVEDQSVGDIAKPESLVVVKNYLAGDITPLSDASDKTVAEVRFEISPMTVVVDAVTIDPDRFGRMRPVLTVEEAARPHDEPVVHSLCSIAELLERGYEEGDIIEMKFVCDRPRLGPIVRKTSVREKGAVEDLLEQKRCPACSQKLAQRHGDFYCDNGYCPSITLDRITHACAPNVLDLAFDKTDLLHLNCELGFPLTLPTLLTLGRDELNIAMIDSEAMRMLETMEIRRRQLHGLGYVEQVQTMAQGKFLDALSLDGLHRKNVRRLQRGLFNQDWVWPDLAGVLSNPTLLQRFAIPRLDTQHILADAQRRHQELQAYAEL